MHDAGQAKPTPPAGDASQDKAQVPTDEPEVNQPTHQQQRAGTSQPSSAAQPQPSAPAAQSALARDPQRAQNAVHPGNGNTQVTLMLQWAGCSELVLRVGYQAVADWKSGELACGCWTSACESFHGAHGVHGPLGFMPRFVNCRHVLLCTGSA